MHSATSLGGRACLVPFAAAHADTVSRWPQGPDELENWAAVREWSSELLSRWHADPSVHPFVLRLDGVVRGYGEIWEDHLELEVELTRVILDPAIRGQGIGRVWIALLAAQARAQGWDSIWVRVVATNAPAIACYRAAGFVRADQEQEAEFNAGQSRAYVWMKHLHAVL